MELLTQLKRLRVLAPPPRGIGLSLVVREIRGGQFLSLREAYISNLSLLQSIEL